MEAPERIYINDTTGEFDDHWSIYKNNESVEYTRTDVVIEKAQNFFRQSHHLFKLDGDELRGFIEDFRKIMKE